MRFVKPSSIGGKTAAPPSKSMMQRAVAAAALASGRSSIIHPSFCDDALAAIGIAKALGAKVGEAKDAIVIEGGGEPKGIVLDCNESGLCMRMFAPIAALFGREFSLEAKGSLRKRHVGMMEGPLHKLGAECKTNNGFAPVIVKGPLHGGRVGIDGSESSQFLTGLLLALPMCKKDSMLEVKNLRSKPYVRMTVSLLEKFGVEIGHDEGLAEFSINGGQKCMPCTYDVEGDWSGAAFLLVAGAIAGRMTVMNLDAKTEQADKRIVLALENAGAKVIVGNGGVRVEKSRLAAFDFDATDCPDLFPPLVALACNCRGISKIAGVGRLRNKESDRASALAEEFAKIGGKVRIAGDVMEIEGKELHGGKVESRGDHRIAMACAVAALTSKKGILINDDSCVSKSFPDFFEKLSEAME
jgi:3-phosphoshikimate 1-carboxyvinyltransferase